MFLNVGVCRVLSGDFLDLAVKEKNNGEYCLSVLHWVD